MSIKDLSERDVCTKYITPGKKPKASDTAPLAMLIATHNGTLSAKELWQRSGLEIDGFYQQLKTEMVRGWILEPEKAEMQKVAET